MANELQRTDLYLNHKELKAKIVAFGGWQMPVSYTSVMEEHHSVRTRVGVFDVSHMGEIFVFGQQALDFLQYLTINDVSKLKVGGGQYSAMCNESGGVVDDLICYRVSSDKYLLCVNASNIDKDFEWIIANKKGFSVQIENQSSLWSQLAIQGPDSPKALADILSPEYKHLSDDLLYTNIATIYMNGRECYVARTGYTGEKGFEIYLPNSLVKDVWQKLINNGVAPIGLGARDTLRLEACYLLYGNEMDDTVSPLEAGIGWAVKLDKEKFIGRDSLVKQKELGLKRSLHAFKMIDQGIPRHGMNIFKDGQIIGTVTSGSVLPTITGAGGMCLIKNPIEMGNVVDIDIRGKLKRAEICKKPLYIAKVKN